MRKKGKSALGKPIASASNHAMRQPSIPAEPPGGRLAAFAPAFHTRRPQPGQ